jgi:hypothetical protein
VADHGIQLASLIQLHTQNPWTSFVGESCIDLHFEDIVQNTFCVFAFLHKLLKSTNIRRNKFQKEIWTKSSDHFSITIPAIFDAIRGVCQLLVMIQD